MLLGYLSYTTQDHCLPREGTALSKLGLGSSTEIVNQEKEKVLIKKRPHRGLVRWLRE